MVEFPISMLVCWRVSYSRRWPISTSSSNRAWVTWRKKMASTAAVLQKAEGIRNKGLILQGLQLHFWQLHGQPLSWRCRCLMTISASFKKACGLRTVQPGPSRSQPCVPRWRSHPTMHWSPRMGFHTSAEPKASNIWWSKIDHEFFKDPKMVLDKQRPCPSNGMSKMTSSHGWLLLGLVTIG